MKNLKDVPDQYLETLKERAKKSRAYTPHQSVGIQLAELLQDPKHISLYIKLAKNHDGAFLLKLGKEIKERRHIENKGAYFMKVLQASDLNKKS